MLKTILKSSGWSQEQLASKLGVSFPTINSWLNNKSVPRKQMQKRIENLYLARNIPYEGPVYITLEIKNYELSINDRVLLTKTLEDGLDGFEVYGVAEDFLLHGKEPGPDEDYSLHVANSPEAIIIGTTSGGRIYDHIKTGTFARVMFISGDKAIAVVEDWGLDIPA